jgi:hypothetical protein
MKKFLSKTKLHYFIIAAVLLAVFVMPGVAQTDPVFVPSGSVSPDVWDPDSSVYSWVNGNAKGYAESDTAAMAATITGQSGAYLKLGICLDAYDTVKDKYLFMDFTRWDRTVLPPWFPGGVTEPMVGYSDSRWDTAFDLVYGFNIDIESVNVLGLGGTCGPNAIDLEVVFTPTADLQAYLFWGGQLAYPGAELPYYHGVIVGGGQGPASLNGTFQSSLYDVGNKTINFAGQDIIAMPQLILTKTVTTPDGTCPGSDVLEIPKGEDVKYCFDLYNGGTADLLNAKLVDPLFGDITVAYPDGGDLTGELSGLVSGNLPAGQHAYAEVVYTDVQKDTLNTATASGSSLNYSSSSQVWVYIIDIEVTKKVSANRTTWLDHVDVIAGDQIWWQIVFTNNSTRSKTIDLTYEDKLNGVPITLICAEGAIPATLAADASFTCTIGPVAAVVGTHTNVIEATGCYKDPLYSPPDICDIKSDSASYKATATITVCKTDTGPQPISGWKVYLDRTDEQLTGMDGCYTYTVDDDDTYRLTEEDRTGWTPQGPTYFDVIVAGTTAAYGPYTFVNFQNMDVQVCKTTTENVPIENWKVYINDVEKLTGENGCATFTITTPGLKTVTEEARAGWTAVPPISYTFTAASGGSYGPYTFKNFQNMDVQVCKTTTENVPIENWKVYINDVEKLTGENGCATFTITTPGLKTVTEEARAGWTAVPPISYTFTAASGGSYGPYTFKNFQNMDVQVCKTTTENVPIENWKVYINDVEKLTGENGCATFPITSPGSKMVTEETRAGWTAIYPIPNNFQFTAASGGSYGPFTFKNFQNVEITACKYKTLSPTEVLSPTPLSMWPVYLYKDADLFESKETGANGCYTWTIIAPGDYQVREGSYPYWTPVGPTVSDIWPVTSGSGPFEVEFYNYREPGCVLTQGYWKNHADPYKQDGKFYDDAWGFVGGPDAPFFDTGQTWIEVLNTPAAGGNAYYILAYQYIAAILNGFNGADTSFVSQELADAEALLDHYDTMKLIPADGTEFSMNDRAMAIELAYILDEFNNGYGGVPHCDF